MKKQILLIVAVVAMAISTISCKKEEEPPVPAKTELQITVLDNLGNPVNAASVTIYTTLTDWNNDTNPVQGTKTTGTDGIVLFSDLQPIVYYIDAQKGALNNWSGANMTASAIEKEKRTMVNIVIQ
jgi:hypothetical protein